MSIFNRFLNLFHQRHRLNPQYETLATLKKWMFFGTTSFIMFLSCSKFFQTNLIYSFEPTEENKLLIKLNPALDRSVYNPTMFMIFGFMQRLYTKYWEEDPYVSIKEEEFGDQTLHWVTLHDKATHNRSDKKKFEIPVVLVIAGSEGFDNTAKHLMLASYNLGYRTVAVDPKDVYDTQKINQIVNHIKSKFPQSTLYGIGIEYGANLLINYAADHPKRFSALVSLGNPFDIVKSEVKIQQSWIWKLLYKNILQGRLQKAKKLNSKLDEKNVESLFELDKHLYNLEDDKLFEWKLKNSSINSIHKLQDTTMFIQSREDPFSQDIGDDERFANEKCIYITTQRGGHNQWLENNWMNRWFVSPIKYFLKLNHQGKIEDILKKQNEQKRK